MKQIPGLVSNRFFSQGSGKMVETIHIVWCSGVRFTLSMKSHPKSLARLKGNKTKAQPFKAKLDKGKSTCQSGKPHY
jgi:hypothetical protein